MSTARDNECDDVADVNAVLMVMSLMMKTIMMRVLRNQWNVLVKSNYVTY